MKWMIRFCALWVALLFAGCETMHQGSAGAGAGRPASSGGKGVRIVTPAPASTHKPGPVEVCIETKGYVVEPAKNGVNEGKGHHHLIIDAPMPDLNQPIPKDARHIHMGDGSQCKTIELGSGVHTIRALFAKGNHIPYNPPVTDTVFVYVGHAL